MQRTNVTKIAQGTTYKYYLVKLFFKNYFFLFFSFCNCILPLAITFVTAYNKSIDSINFVIGTGLVAGFIISFYQFGFAFSLAMLNLLSNLKKNDSTFIGVKQQHIVSYQYIGAFFIGLVLMGMFITLCYLYLHFSGNYPNTHNVAHFGDQFAFVTSPTIVIVLLDSVTLFNIFYRVGNLRTTILTVSQLIINIFFVTLIGLLTPQLQIYGFAIGLLVGSVINLLITALISWFLEIRMSLRVDKNAQKHLLKIFWSMSKVSFINLYYTGMRVLVVLTMASTFKTYTHFAPYNFMLAKVIYFLVLYCLAFVNNGTQYTLSYIKATYSKYSNIFNASYKANWIIGVSMGLLVSACSIAFFFSTPYLIQHFTLNVPAEYKVIPWEPGPHVQFYIGPWGPYGVMSYISFTPYSKNATLVLICVDVVILTLTSSMMVDPISKKKPKNKLLSLISQIWRPTATLIFIVGFGFGMFGKGPFQWMESFATAYTINACVLFLVQLYQYIRLNKKFATNYKKIDFISMMWDKLMIENQENYNKIVKYEMFPKINRETPIKLMSYIFK